jgi:hypothetical protein
MTMSRHQPALLGGLLIGVLSSLPIVKAGNLCCCLWVVSGGLLTVYLQQQQKAEPIETGEAVLGGLIAGLIGAVIVCVFTYIAMIVMGPVIQSSLASVQSALESNADMPPAARDLALSAMRMMTGGGAIVIGLLITIPLYAVFSMLGALLGTALFRKKQPPVVQG